VVASTTGFVASIVVSYVLQRAWVFRSATRHAVAGRRFLTVTAVAFALNATLLWIGTEVLRAPFVPAQIVALIAIPCVNYVMNARWTFRVA
jgi:putative flippase GtrA